MGRAPDYLTVAQFELLEWIAGGCMDGVYEGTSYRVSARALHNRGLIQITGRGKTWTAKITEQGTQRLKEQSARIEAERERVRREDEARRQKEIERRQLRTRAVELLKSVEAAGGRLELDELFDENALRQIEECLARDRLFPDGQRLTHESTRMDPILGVTAYLEPDFAVLTSRRHFTVPRQLRNPHPTVVAFRDKRAYVSKQQVSRAARFLQALVSAAADIGWKVPKNPPASHSARDEERADLSLRLPSRELDVTICELDERGRTGNAFITTTDYFTNTQRTTVNKRFQAAGRLEIRLTDGWDDRSFLALRDTHESSLEEQLPTLIHRLEVAEAEATWAQQEEARRAEIREVRWKEVKNEAFTKVTYQRNAERLRDELKARDAAAAMREYADEIDARATQFAAANAKDAREWAGWIRAHVEKTDPLNSPLHLVQVTTCSHEELQPHMNGWSTYGPHRR